MEPKICNIILRSTEPKSCKILPDVYFQDGFYNQTDHRLLTPQTAPSDGVSDGKENCCSLKHLCGVATSAFQFGMGESMCMYLCIGNKLLSHLVKKKFLHMLLIQPHACNCHRLDMVYMPLFNICFKLQCEGLQQNSGRSVTVILFIIQD